LGGALFGVGFSIVTQLAAGEGSLGDRIRCLDVADIAISAALGAVGVPAGAVLSKARTANRVRNNFIQVSRASGRATNNRNLVNTVRSEIAKRQSSQATREFVRQQALKQNVNRELGNQIDATVDDIENEISNKIGDQSSDGSSDSGGSNQCGATSDEDSNAGEPEDAEDPEEDKRCPR
jgi:hypothetical protein